MSDLPDHPLKWLLAQLPEYLTSAQIERLLTAFDAHKRTYAHAVKIRDAERRIRIYERWPDQYDPTNLQRWKNRLAKLKEQAE